MFLIGIYNYMRGFLTITVEGYFVERFINICAHRNIYLWNVRRLGDHKMRINISVQGYKKLATISYKTRSEVKITHKHGLPFLFNKYNKRFAFIGGIGVFAVLIFTMTLFIWEVDVNGNADIPTEIISTKLNELGLGKGSFIKALNIEEIKNTFLIDMSEIAWIGINVKGTKASIEIRERVQIPKVVTEYTPSHIVALRAGIIKSIDATSGERLAKIGDAVAKGQLLVSGAIDSQVLGARFVHSSAKISAETSYEEIAEILPYIDERVPTGEKENKHCLQIFGLNINFFLKNETSYAEYDRISGKRSLTLGKDIVLPFSIEFTNYFEIQTQRKELASEAAERQAAERLTQIINETTAHAEVIGIFEEIIYIEDRPYLKMIYTCLEDIGIQEEIIY